VSAELIIHLEDRVSIKTVQRELQISKIHSRAAVAEPLISENNAEK
jgi:predicted DNA-binding transcriptional regulator